MSNDLFDEVLVLPKEQPTQTVTDVRPVALFVADVHWRNTVPEYRTEVGDFSLVIRKKLKELLAYSVANTNLHEPHHVPIFVAGDMFDGARDFLQYFTLSSLLHEFAAKYWRVPIFAVRGQHDMQHHNRADKTTSFNALVRAGYVTAFEGKRGEFVSLSCANGPCRVYGAGWGFAPLIPENPDANNILLWHNTLWHKKSVFPGQTEGNVEIESIKLSELGYKMVFSGDNHKAFDCKIGGVQFHNLGAFTRNAVDLADQQPRFCVLFSDGSVRSEYVGETDVFDTVRSTDNKSHEGAKDEFSLALAGGFNQGDTFEGALELTAKSGRCGDLELTATQLDVLRDTINHVNEGA
jgi:uncharacterized protein (UPF0179 family)